MECRLGTQLTQIYLTDTYITFTEYSILNLLNVTFPQLVVTILILLYFTYSATSTQIFSLLVVPQPVAPPQYKSSIGVSI